MERSLALRFALDLIFRDTALKAVALLFSAVLFVVTRNEVTRAFEVPLRVVDDPTRMLMTQLPNTVQVRIRGPWTRVSQLQGYELGSAELDLRDVEPGPMELEQGSIVMPPGVLLVGIQYDQVDLRFDPVERVEIPIVPPTVGRVHADYHVVRVEVVPERWTVSGGRSQLNRVSEVTTAALNIEGATETIERTVRLEPPSESLELVGDQPRTRVRVIVEPRIMQRDFAVLVAISPAIDPTGLVPRSYGVRGSGPAPQFRRLEQLGLAFPIEADVELEPVGSDGGERAIHIEFKWSEAVPPEIRSSITMDHQVTRVVLPPVPPVVPTTSAPKP